MGDLILCPVSFREAAAFVARHHRHHKPPRGMKFAVGVENSEQLVGVAIASRPVARMFDDGVTLEVARTCTLGHPNANSMLYGATWRAAKALGYRRLVTYTLASESGSSLRAAGWRIVAQRAPRSGWDMPSRPRRNDSTKHGVQRTLWEAV